MVKAKFTKKKKNCNKGWGCGNSCISKNKGCKIRAKEGSKKLLDMLSTGKALSSDAATKLLAKKSWSEKDVATFNSLGDEKKVSLGVSLAKKGKKDLLLAEKPESKELKVESKKVPSEYTATKYIRSIPPLPEKFKDKAQIEAYLKNTYQNDESPFGEKVNKNLGEDEFSWGDSFAMSRWTSNLYQDINGSILGKALKTETGVLAANLLNDAISKAPKYSDKAALEALTERGLSDKMNKSDYTLVRKISPPIGMQEAVLKRKMLDAEANGGILTNDTFDAYSYSTDVTAWKGKLSMIVKPAEKSKAAMVDKYKNVYFEAEALYPTGTKYSLDKVVVNGKEFSKYSDVEEYLENNIEDTMEIYMTELDF